MQDGSPEDGLKLTGEEKAEVWNGYQWVKLYAVHETVPRKQASPKQREAIQKARGLTSCKDMPLLQRGRLQEGAL